MSVGVNILHLTPYYAPAYAFGGVVRSVEGMARALVRHGHQVTVLTTDALDARERYRGQDEEWRDGVRVLHAANLSRHLRGRLNLSTPSKMQAIARSILPEMDVVHCHEFRTTENLLVTPVAAEMDKPLVLSPHGTLVHRTGRSRLKIAWDKVVGPAVAQRFSHIIGLTDQEVREAQNLWATFDAPTPTFSTIPNAIDPHEYDQIRGGTRFRARYGLGEGPVCLFMSRLHPRKGLRVLVEAFRLLDLPDARLVIAGPDEGLLDYLTPHLGDAIIYTGFLDGADRLAALAAADLFALPATGEGLPMVVLEAMGAGLPVLISPECYLPQVASAGVGLVVEPQIEPLRAALQVLLSDAPQRQAMGARGRHLVQTQFTWDAVALQLATVYRSLVAVVE
jgi:glycosyltransferase involved in cell wall biosynthesis